MHITDRRLWLTQDKERIVEDGDPNAAFLFATPGTEVPDAEAKRYGLKARHKPQDKQAAASANKGDVPPTPKLPRA